MLKEWWQTHAPRLPLPFVDVFCETKAFDLEQSRQILTRAGSLGFPLKIHADEFDNLGGATLAAEMGAASADHLVRTSDADIQALAKSADADQSWLVPENLAPSCRARRNHARRSGVGAGIANCIRTVGPSRSKGGL